MAIKLSIQIGEETTLKQWVITEVDTSYQMCRLELLTDQYLA